MHYFKRITLFTVLAAFVINTAISDCALALAPESRFDDMGGIQHLDTARIEMALEAQLADRSLRRGDGTLDIVRFAKQAGQHSDSIFRLPVLFTATPVQLFTAKPEELPNGYWYIKCRASDDNTFNGHGARTYYAVFPGHVDDKNGFPIEVYTQREWADNGVMAHIKAARSVPQRKAYKPGDVRIKDEYKENNERIIANFIRERIAAGDFTEIKGRAQELGWNKRYPNRIRPEAYLPETLYTGMRTSANAFLRIFEINFGTVFANKNFVFIRVPRAIGYPRITESGQQVSVRSRISNNAVYFFLTPEEYRDINEVMANPGNLTAPSLQIYRILEPSLMHEIGAACGLPFTVSDGRLVNDLDRALSIWRSTDRHLALLKDYEASLAARFPKLRGIKPVDLVILRGVNSAGQPYERDYASPVKSAMAEIEAILSEKGLTRQEHFDKVRAVAQAYFPSLLSTLDELRDTGLLQKTEEDEIIRAINGAGNTATDRLILRSAFLPIRQSLLLSAISVSDTEDEMGRVAATNILRDIEAVIDERGRAVMLFASAPSQHATWKHLIEAWKKLPAERQKYLGERIIAFHMDEYIGLPENAEQLFGKVLRERVFGELSIKPENTYYFNDRIGYETARELRQALAANDSVRADKLTAQLESELKPHIEEVTRKFTKSGGVFDVVIGGIGKLPHLAFNDPPEAKFNDPQAIKIVRLTETSRQQQVDDKEFAKIEDVPTHAITFSLPPILNGRRIHIMVPRSFKAEAVRESLDMPVGEARPASGLRLPDVLPNVKIYLDNDSAALSKVAQSAAQTKQAQHKLLGVGEADLEAARMVEPEPLISVPVEQPEYFQNSSLPTITDELADISTIAGKAGLEIPTAMNDRYTLLFMTEFFKDYELPEQRSEYADRFNMNTVSGSTPEQFIQNVLVKAQGIENKTIVIVPDDLTQEDLAKLTIAGIKFIRMNRAELATARGNKDPYRKQFQIDTYAMMLLARRIDVNTEESSPIYQALRFYVRTHFQLANSIAADEYIEALKKNEVAKVILGYLAYRPAKQYDTVEYNTVAAALISA